MNKQKYANEIGAKAKAQDASGFCRLCKVSFKPNGTYLSYENLYKSTKAGAGNLSLSKIITGTLVCLNSEPFYLRMFARILLAVLAKSPGARFSKVPRLSGRVSGDIKRLVT